MRRTTGRRGFTRVLAGAAGIAVVGGPALGKARQGARLDELPWPYARLDPAAVGDRAFASYAKGHCMYGAFDALAGTVAERLGPPYTTFPFDMFEYGAGGINGWGTICGALNGSAAAFKLLSKEPGPLVDWLFAWYEREQLPDVTVAKARYANVPSAAGSPLCHTSVSRWCEAASKASYSPERKERCGVLTAAVARRAAQLLNAQAAGGPLPVLPAGGAARTCGQCHEKGGDVENTRSKMDCSSCHFHLRGEHPKT